jgi:hypothetical protein
MRTVSLRGVVMRMRVADHSTDIRLLYRKLLGCALLGSLGILLLDALVLWSGVYYYSDDVYVLYSVAVLDLTVVWVKQQSIDQTKRRHP